MRGTSQHPSQFNPNWLPAMVNVSQPLQDPVDNTIADEVLLQSYPSQSTRSVRSVEVAQRMARYWGAIRHRPYLQTNALPNTRPPTPDERSRHCIC